MGYETVKAALLCSYWFVYDLDFQSVQDKEITWGWKLGIALSSAVPNSSQTRLPKTQTHPDPDYALTDPDTQIHLRFWNR